MQEPTRLTRRDALRWTLAGAGAALTSPAWAQPADPAGAVPADPNPLGTEPSPHLTTSREKNWTVVTNLNVRSYQDRLIGLDESPNVDRWSFETLALVLPLVTWCANARVAGTDDAPAVSGKLEVAETTVDSEPRIVPGYQGGSSLALFEASRAEHRVIGGNVRELDAELRTEMVCARTAFDERSASRVAWPTGDWPAAARSTFGRMTYVDYDPGQQAAYDPKPVTARLREWTDGRDPKAVRPVPLAKWLAGQLAQAIQPSGSGLRGTSGYFEGFELRGGPPTIEAERGSEFDMPCALVALYRAAGLPARLVIGYDADAAKGRDNAFDQESGPSALRAWCEFALYDEPEESLAWIPVDIVGIRKNASRLRGGWMDNTLRGFGEMRDGDGLIPIAHHFHPPTTVRAYGYPAMWGWLTTPRVPAQAFQSIQHRAESTPLNRRGRR